MTIEINTAPSRNCIIYPNLDAFNGYNKEDDGKTEPGTNSTISDTSRNPDCRLSFEEIEENETKESVAKPTTNYGGSKIGTLIRDNSLKLGSLAETVVLPTNKRSTKRRKREEISIRDEEENKSSLSIKGHYYQFPFFIMFVSAIQVLLFYKGDEIKDRLFLYLWYDPHRRYEIWRYLTTMLVHDNKYHLWLNMIVQLILGIPLEIVHHWKRIGFIYLSSVIGGSLLTTVVTPHVYALGASAGVFGLLFAHISTFILNWNEMDYKWSRLIVTFSFISLLVGYNVYEFYHLELKAETSHVGHTGGAVAGFLVACLALKNFEKHPWEKKYQKICAGILFVLFAFIILVNISFPSFYFKSQFNFNYGECYDSSVFKSAILSGADSELHKMCVEDPECKEELIKYQSGKEQIPCS